MRERGLPIGGLSSFPPSNAGAPGSSHAPIPPRPARRRGDVHMPSASPPGVLIELIVERLAFERRIAALYDCLLARDAPPEPGGNAPSDEESARLAGFRDEERDHVRLLSRCLRQLGGDPGGRSDAADGVMVETAGLAAAMDDPRTGARQAMRLLLDAELLDNAGWDLLCETARASGADTLVDAFEQALLRENEQLHAVRDIVARITLLDTQAGARAGELAG